jgi:protein-tyrosine-phosphatase
VVQSTELSLFICIMKKVIFVCTSNVCRSPAAVALAVKWAIDNGRNDEFSFCSRGISTDFEPEGSEPSDLSVQVLQNDFGIDIRAHRSQMLLDEDVSTAFVIVALTESHRSCIISDFPKGMKTLFLPNLLF